MLLRKVERFSIKEFHEEKIDAVRRPIQGR